MPNPRVMASTRCFPSQPTSSCSRVRTNGQTKSGSSVLVGLAIFTLAFLAAVVTECGTPISQGSSVGPQTTPMGSTELVLELSSTANDQLSLFGLHIGNIDLVNQSGKTVNIFSSSVIPTSGQMEFIHLNGGTTPVVKVNIPQDVYVSANVSLGGSVITCITVSSGGILYSDFGYEMTSYSNVKLPEPVTVSGTAMVLILNLDVSQSASLSSCTIGSSYAITPTFVLSPVAISFRPTNAQNGKLSELKGTIASTNSATSSFTVTMTDSLPGTGTTTFTSNAGTAYFGVGGLASLSTGMFVDMDAAIQPDGSFLATRVAVEDPSATNSAVGLLLFTSIAEPAFLIANRQFQGADLPSEMWYYSFNSNTTFHISSEFTNLSALPFPATFNSSTMVGGQNIYVSSLNFPNNGSFPYTPATTVTLLPQTIDGMIFSITNSGDFQVYTVTLAPYDLFPTLTGQTGLGYSLNTPNVVTVYADANAQMLNTSPIETGSVMRFHGLIFNDNGNLRMDCNQVNDGVAE
jgi:hypothetical protein